MIVANLTRYENLLVGDMSDEREMTECATGSYVKFEEAMEVEKQLKAEIAKQRMIANFAEAIMDIAQKENCNPWTVKECIRTVIELYESKIW